MAIVYRPPYARRVRAYKTVQTSKTTMTEEQREAIRARVHALGQELLGH